MRLIRTLTILLITTSTTFGQFPLFDGENASGIIGVNNQSGDEILPISYDISKNKIKFSLLKTKPINSGEVAIPDNPESPQFWKPQKIKSFELSSSLEDFTFNLNSTSSFDLNISATAIGRKINYDKLTGTTGAGYELKRRFLLYSFKPIIAYERKENHLSERLDNSFVLKNIESLNLGLSSGVSTQTYEDGEVKRSFGLNIFTGYFSQDLESLDKLQLCEFKREGTLGVNKASISDCKTVLDGNVQSTLRAVFNIDYSAFLISPFSSTPKPGSGEKLPDFNNPVIYLLTRFQVKTQKGSNPKYGLFFGLSLGRTDGQAYASILVNVANLSNSKDPTIFKQESANATVSIPINP